MADLTRLATCFNGKWLLFLGKDIYESTRYIVLNKLIPLVYEQDMRYKK